MSLIAPRFKAAEYARSIWCASVEHGVPPTALVEPKYWAHVANQLKVGDRIEITPESHEWFAELYVVDVGPNFARVAMLRLDSISQSADSLPQDEDFVVLWKGPQRKFAVVRKSDKAIIYDGCATKDAAVAKLSAHTRSAVAA